MKILTENYSGFPQVYHYFPEALVSFLPKQELVAVGKRLPLPSTAYSLAELGSSTPRQVIGHAQLSLLAPFCAVPVSRRREQEGSFREGYVFAEIICDSLPRWP